MTKIITHIHARGISLRATTGPPPAGRPVGSLLLRPRRAQAPEARGRRRNPHRALAAAPPVLPLRPDAAAAHRASARPVRCAAPTAGAKRWATATTTAWCNMPYATAHETMKRDRPALRHRGRALAQRAPARAGSWQRGLLPPAAARRRPHRRLHRRLAEGHAQDPGPLRAKDPDRRSSRGAEDGRAHPHMGGTPAMASAKSPLMPMESRSRPLRAAIARSRAKWGRGSSSAGGMHMRPAMASPWTSRQSRRKASAASGAIPAFCGSRPVFTCTKSCSGLALLLHFRGQRLRRSSGDRRCGWHRTAAPPRPPCWTGAGRSGAVRDRARRSCRAGHLALASCTRFSPKTRWPASMHRAMMSGASKVLLTAISVTLAGRPAGRLGGRGDPVQRRSSDPRGPCGKLL